MPEFDTVQPWVSTAADAQALLLRSVDPRDAAAVHAVYLATPTYFRTIAIPVPTSSEVRTELRAAAADDKRHVLLILADPSWTVPGLPRDRQSGRPVAGVLDFKLDFPESGDATINLLLVHEAVQRRGLGQTAVRVLEGALRGRARRVLAAVYGHNPSACGFWEGQGYRFAIDARPLLDWYAKDLTE